MECGASASRALSADGSTRALRCTRSRNATRSTIEPREIAGVCGTAPSRADQAPALADARHDRRFAPGEPRAPQRAVARSRALQDAHLRVELQLGAVAGRNTVTMRAFEQHARIGDAARAAAASHSRVDDACASRSPASNQRQAARGLPLRSGAGSASRRGQRRCTTATTCVGSRAAAKPSNTPANNEKPPITRARAGC